MGKSSEVPRVVGVGAAGTLNGQHLSSRSANRRPIANPSLDQNIFISELLSSQPGATAQQATSRPAYSAVCRINAAFGPDIPGSRLKLTDRVNFVCRPYILYSTAAIAHPGGVKTASAEFSALSGQQQLQQKTKNRRYV